MQAKVMYQYIRELTDPKFRLEKFWSSQPDFQEYNFQGLKEWCGLDLPNDTIHSVKGDEKDNVVLYGKGNYPSSFKHKNSEEKINERKVWYTGATRARKTLHLLRTDYKYNYPLGADYLIYVQEKNDK